MEHTKEPWGIRDDLALLCDSSGETVKSTPTNLRRIVACVNACAGIGTEMLEILLENNKTLAGVIEDLENERYELKEKATGMAQKCTCCGGSHGELGDMDCGTYGGY